MKHNISLYLMILLFSNCFEDFTRVDEIQIEQKEAKQERLAQQRLKDFFINHLNQKAVPENRIGEIRHQKYFYFIKENKENGFSLSNVFLVEPSGIYKPNTALIRQQYRNRNVDRSWLLGPFTNRDDAVQNQNNLKELAKANLVDISFNHNFYYLMAIPVEPETVPSIPKKKDFEKLIIQKKTSLRSEPTSSSKILKRLEQGSRVAVLEKTSKYWWKVNYQGQEGYVKVLLLK